MGKNPPVFVGGLEIATCVSFRSHPMALDLQHMFQVMSEETKWLLFLPQVPSSPSSLRVTVWRRLRAAGAARIQTSVWALPHTPEHETLFKDLLAELTPQGGSALLLRAEPLEPDLNQTIIESFRQDRDEEYGEVLERCADFRAEITKETEKRKFTFAELEENEVDLHRLESWLATIRTRDFFGAQQADAAQRALERCREAFHGFAEAVYEAEEITSDPLTPPTESGDDYG